MGAILGISGLAGAGKDTVADLLVNEFSFVKVAFADPIKRAAMDWWDFSEEQLWGPSEMRNKPDHRYPNGAQEYRDAYHREMRLAEEAGDDSDKAYMHLMSAMSYEKEGWLSPRQALQQIGTEVARALDKDVWLRYGLKVARQLLQRPGHLNYQRTIGVVEEKRDTPIAGVVLSDARFANELIHISEEGGRIIRIKRPSAGLSGKEALHASEIEHQSWDDDKFDYVLDNSGTLYDLRDRVEDMVEALLGSAAEPAPKQLELFR